MRRLLVAGLLSGLLPIAAQAADMIDDGDYRQARASTNYYTASYEVCNDLVLAYRAPHEPRRDLVRVCHHPALPGE